MSKKAELKASRGFDVPNVFVVPPEEDDVPSWCFFNAALPPDQQIHHLDETDRDSRQTYDPTSPYADSDSDDHDHTNISPTADARRRNLEGRSILETLMARDTYNIDHAALDSDSDHMEWDDSTENVNEFQPHPARPRPRSRGLDTPRRPLSEEVGNDSDVIEVVRVSRRRDMGELEYRPAPSSRGGVQRAGTIKARATKAIRSFTSTFRSSRSKTKDILLPRPSTSMSGPLHSQGDGDSTKEKESTPPPGHGTMSRHFSQFFTAPMNGGNAPPTAASSQSSFSSIDAPPPVSSSSSSGPVHESPSTTFTAGRSSMSYDTAPRRSSIYDRESLPPDTVSRAASPTTNFFATTGRSTKRFAKLNLSRMFSFSTSHSTLEDGSHSTTTTSASASQDTSSRASGTSTPPSTLKRKSSSLPSSTTSTESSGPQTPTTDEGLDNAPRISLATSTTSTSTSRSKIVYDEDGRSPQLDFGEFDTNMGLAILGPLSLSSSSSQPLALAESLSLSLGPSTSAGTHTYSGFGKSSSTTNAPLRKELGRGQRDVEEHEGDVSFEMRLDSLHFDDLSFDAEGFRVELNNL